MQNILYSYLYLRLSRIHVVFYLEKIKSFASDYNKKKIKDIILLICLLSNLSILFFFKYANFTIDVIYFANHYLGISRSFSYFDIILPVGISFYTFQALGYTIDVYRDDIYAEKNFLKYALFVSFFPQLVAGTIFFCKNRSKDSSNI